MSHVRNVINQTYRWHSKDCQELIIMREGKQVMYAFLGLASIFGIIVSIIMMIYSIKRKTSKKKPLLLLIVCIMLFSVAMALTPKDEKKEEEPKETVKQAETKKEPETVKETLSPEKQEPTPMETIASETQPSQNLSFVLVDGEIGDYGENVTLNAGTEFEEAEIIYKLPTGTYNVTYSDKGSVQISVYNGGPVKNGEWEEFIADDSCQKPVVLMSGDTKELEIREGQFITLSDGSTNVQFEQK